MAGNRFENDRRRRYFANLGRSSQSLFRSRRREGGEGEVRDVCGRSQDVLSRQLEIFHAMQGESMWGGRIRAIAVYNATVSGQRTELVPGRLDDGLTSRRRLRRKEPQAA